MRYIDERAIKTIDEIQGHGSRPRVVLVMSDHGTRSRLNWNDLAHADTDEALANLFAAYTPGHERLFPENVTTVNIYPLLFNTYFGTALPTQPNRTFGFGKLHELVNPDAD